MSIHIQSCTAISITFAFVACHHSEAYSEQRIVSGQTIVDAHSETKEQSSVVQSPEPEITKPALPARQLPEDYLAFTHACDPGTQIRLAFVGDVLLHQELQRQAYSSEDGFRTIWSNVADLLAQADITYANLEGPMAEGVHVKGHEVQDPGRVYDRKVYTAYPRFNYHPSLAEDLKKTGVDIVSTANNHALDRGSLGADKTISALKKARLAFMGTRLANDNQEQAWVTTTSANGLNLAWLACTHHTNQIVDEHEQVLYCYRNQQEMLRLLKTLKQRPDIDAVIVTPHWGNEYQTKPDKQQIQFAHQLAEAGALAIIGSHPHVLQPWERYLTKDGREVLIHYSLGNFASHQIDLANRSSMILYLGLTRLANGQTHIHGVRYIPLYVRKDGQRFFTEAIDRIGQPAESRALITSMFKHWNLLSPDEPLVTHPHCDPAWEFPKQ